jgi:hypothetical protein
MRGAGEARAATMPLRTHPTQPPGPAAPYRAAVPAAAAARSRQRRGTPCQAVPGAPSPLNPRETQTRKPPPARASWGARVGGGRARTSSEKPPACSCASRVTSFEKLPGGG